MNIINNIARQVATRRRARKLTQVQLAAMIGIDQAMVSLIERARAPSLPATYLPKLAAALGCQPADLLASASADTTEAA